VQHFEAKMRAVNEGRFRIENRHEKKELFRKKKRLEKWEINRPSGDFISALLGGLGNTPTSYLCHEVVPNIELAKDETPA